MAADTSTSRREAPIEQAGSAPGGHRASWYRRPVLHPATDHAPTAARRSCHRTARKRYAICCVRARNNDRSLDPGAARKADRPSVLLPLSLPRRLSCPPWPRTYILRRPSARSLAAPTPFGLLGPGGVPPWVDSRAGVRPTCFRRRLRTRTNDWSPHRITPRCD